MVCELFIEWEQNLLKFNSSYWRIFYEKIDLCTGFDLFIPDSFGDRLHMQRNCSISMYIQAKEICYICFKFGSFFFFTKHGILLNQIVNLVEREEPSEFKKQGL